MNRLAENIHLCKPIFMSLVSFTRLFHRYLLFLLWAWFSQFLKKYIQRETSSRTTKIASIIVLLIKYQRNLSVEFMTIVYPLYEYPIMLDTVHYLK
jgi:uncharacterized membrane protein YbaN (DUF454 family)